MRRAVRRAKKAFRAQKLEPGRPAWKPKWQRWKTYDRLEAVVDAALPIIEADENALHDAIDKLEARLEAKLSAPRRKRGRPVKAIVTTNHEGKKL